jgi:hypothetical protein
VYGGKMTSDRDSPFDLGNLSTKLPDFGQSLHNIVSHPFTLKTNSLFMSHAGPAAPNPATSILEWMKVCIQVHTYVNRLPPLKESGALATSRRTRDSER